jgi:multiple sugar transport system permease protein
MFGTLDGLLARLDERCDRLGRRTGNDAATATLLLSPALLLLAVFGLAPIGYALYLSLFEGKAGQGALVWLGNYGEALRSEDFWQSFFVTVYYALGTVPATMALSFFIAYGLHRIIRGRGLLRTVYFLPYITSAVAAALVWRSLFNAQSGAFNILLDYAGMAPQQWLLEPRGVLHILTGGWVPAGLGPSLALCCVMVFDIWHNCGFMVVIFLAGLATVPRELEEVACIDGANAWQVIRNVTLPLLSPTLFFLAIISTIKAFQAFNSFYALVGIGRTLGTTENLVLHIYDNFYGYGDWGYGTAVATLLCVAIIALTLFQWRFVGKRVHYE